MPIDDLVLKTKMPLRGIFVFRLDNICGYRNSRDYCPVPTKYLLCAGA